MLNICVAILKGGWRVKLLRYLSTGTCRRGGSTKLFSGYLTMGSRHYHLRWTLYYLKWICNNQRCQIVASLPSSKQFWEEQRRRGGATPSKMHRWRFAIFGCNFRPRILHWVLAAFFTRSRKPGRCARLSPRRDAQTPCQSPRPIQHRFFQNWVPASAIQVMHTATYVMQWLRFTLFGCNLIGDCTKCVSPLLFIGHVFVH